MREFRSKRLEMLVQSDIRAMSRECDLVGGINLGQGICDLPTPSIIAEAAKDAIDRNQSVYSYPEGLLELRIAVAEKLARDNEIVANPQSEIVVTSGASGAFAATLLGLFNPGDGVLVMEPYYGYHVNTAQVVGIEVQYMTLSAPSFSFSKEQLEACIQPNTRAIVVCTPSNPSGKMFSKRELEMLGQVADEYDLLIITDEIYEYIRFDNRQHISAASLPGLWERTVSIMGLSKTYSITGWRLGYVVAPAKFAQAITVVNDLFYVCAPTPLQAGVAAGFAMGEDFYVDQQVAYQRKRDMLCSALAQAGMEPIVPQGAYYILADVGRLGFQTARNAANVLLKQAGVAAIPGSAFYRGAEGERLLRFCFAKDTQVLGEACRRLIQFGRSRGGKV